MYFKMHVYDFQMADLIDILSGVNNFEDQSENQLKRHWICYFFFISHFSFLQLALLSRNKVCNYIS